MATSEKVMASSFDEQVSYTDEPKLRSEEVNDGDLALKVLHTSFEPYTAAEEKKLLRKIDIRLAFLMLFVNGIQFVDKLVSDLALAPIATNQSRPYRKLRHTAS